MIIRVSSIRDQTDDEGDSDHGVWRVREMMRHETLLRYMLLEGRQWQPRQAIAVRKILLLLVSILWELYARYSHTA